MTTVAGLLGATLFLGKRPTGKVTGVLVDGGRTPVLLRVLMSPTGEIAYAPPAALTQSPGGVQARGAHVLLHQGEASFYDQPGLEWVSCDDV